MPCCLQEDDCAILNQQLARRSEELTNTKAELQKAAATNGQLSSGLKNAASKFENAQKACGVASPRQPWDVALSRLHGVQACSPAAALYS